MEGGGQNPRWNRKSRGSGSRSVHVGSGRGHAQPPPHEGSFIRGHNDSFGPLCKGREANEIERGESGSNGDSLGGPGGLRPTCLKQTDAVGRKPQHTPKTSHHLLRIENEHHCTCTRTQNFCPAAAVAPELLGGQTHRLLKSSCPRPASSQPRHWVKDRRGRIPRPGTRGLGRPQHPVVAASSGET